MSISDLRKGDIFRIENPDIIANYSLFGNEKNIVPNKTLPKGTYYVIEDKKEPNVYLISDIQPLKGDFYLLGKMDTYFVEKNRLKNVLPIDTVPESERKEVLKTLKALQK